MTRLVASSIQTGTTEAIDQHWMSRALNLAWLASGRVSPNPAVGAVIVRDGDVVGEGYTEPPGQRHAEIVALDHAGDRAAGATMYVTLEPCAHHGRTPPCLDAVLHAGISRIVIAARDPNPLVNGRSIISLREHGVVVDLGTGATEAIQIIAGFLRRLQTGLPEVHVKYAMSLDGKIATRTGHSRWITGPDARRKAHMIRDRSDAILVGIGTVLADDPKLTTRLDPAECGSGGPHHPLRVVVDGHARTPINAAMLGPETPGSTMIAVSGLAPAERVTALQQAGADVVEMPSSNGQINLQALLRYLGDQGINSLMVEGGAQIIGSLADIGAIDRVTAFVAPVLLGGADAPTPISGDGVPTADAGLRLTSPAITQEGDDVCISGYVAGRYPDGEELRCSPGS